MSLKEKLQSELHLPHRRDEARNRTRPARRRNLRRESPAGHGRQELIWRSSEARVRHGELRRVEDVEHLGAELQPQLLAKLNVFNQRYVKVLITGAFQNARPGAAVMTELRQILVQRPARIGRGTSRLRAGDDPESVGVEPFVDGAV